MKVFAIAVSEGDQVRYLKWVSDDGYGEQVVDAPRDACWFDTHFDATAYLRERRMVVRAYGAYPAPIEVTRATVDRRS